MDGAALVGFAVMMAVGQFSPGPDMILLTRTALNEGLRAGWAMVAGIVTGLAVHASLAISGMAVLLANDGMVSQVVRIMAALYLSWLAWGLLKKKDNVEGVQEVVSPKNPYLRGLFCNLLNPKVLVFFAGVVAPFLDGDPLPMTYFAIWGIIVIEGLVLWSLWVWLLQFPGIQRAYQRAGRTLDVLFAAGLSVFAVLLLRS